MYAFERRAQRGFSLVELMVSMVISLLVSLAALSAAQQFMSSQRQGVGVGSATANASSALAALKFEAAQAGLGFYARGLMPCTNLNLSVNEDTVSDGGAYLPFSVQSTSATNTTLTLSYGSLLEAAVPVVLKTASSSAAAQVELKSYLPVAAGQTVMIAPPVGVPGTCTVRTASQVVPASSATGTGMTLLFDGGGRHNDTAFSATTEYDIGSQVFLLGALQQVRFAVRNGDLVMERPLDSAASVVLAKNVVGFAVQYGTTDAGSTTLQGWQYPEGAWETLDAVEASRVKALRIGLVTRADQREKPAADGSCVATSEQPVLLDRALALTGDWQCFKYRSQSVVVPLRNMMLGFAA